MKRPLIAAAAFAAAAGCFAASPGASFGDSAATVAAKVTVAAPCLTLNATTLDFGTLGFSTESAGAQGNGTSVLSNCGSAAENLAVRGTNAAGASGAAWALVARSQSSLPCDLGTNKYVLKADAFNSTWSTVLAGFDLTTTSQTLVNVAAGAPQNIDYDLWMPCSGSSGAGETMTFEIVYTASL